MSARPSANGTEPHGSMFNCPYCSKPLTSLLQQEFACLNRKCKVHFMLRPGGWNVEFGKYNVYVFPDSSDVYTSKDGKEVLVYSINNSFPFGVTEERIKKLVLWK